MFPEVFKSRAKTRTEFLEAAMLDVNKKTWTVYFCSPVHCFRIIFELRNWNIDSRWGLSKMKCFIVENWLKIVDQREIYLQRLNACAYLVTNFKCGFLMSEDQGTFFVLLAPLTSRRLRELSGVELLTNQFDILGCVSSLMCFRSNIWCATEHTPPNNARTPRQPLRNQLRRHRCRQSIFLCHNDGSQRQSSDPVHGWSRARQKWERCDKIGLPTFPGRGATTSECLCRLPGIFFMSHVKAS